MLQRIRKDDIVTIRSGRDKGKQGQVLIIDRKADKALIKGVNIVTRHVKPKRQGEKGGIIKEEAYLSLTKVMPVCPRCKLGCRIKTKHLENKNKARTCHRCNDEF